MAFKGANLECGSCSETEVSEQLNIRMNNGEKVMKNMKYGITFGIALVCAMLFTACDNIADTPEIQTPIENGYGRISISLTEGDAAPQSERTVMPSTVFSKYVYTFTKTGETTGTVKASDNDGFFTLEIGNYTVLVQAYTGNAEPYTLAASGVSPQFSVGSGSNNQVRVPLSGVTVAAQGEFVYTITYPAGATATISLQKWPELGNITLNPVDTQLNGKTQTLELDAGSYLLTVLISKNELYAGISEAVHIKPSLSTVYTKNFANDDLLVTPTPVTSDFTVTGTGTFTYNGSPMAVTIVPKTGRSTGVITIFYNGTNTAPTDAGEYEVTFNVEAVKGWNAATGLPAGTITINKTAGVTVNAPTSSSVTSDSITLNAVTEPSNGQTVEYVINTANVVPTTGWQDSATFSGLTAGTTYYIFARSKANANYNAGTASASLQVTTPSKYTGATVSAPTGIRSSSGNSIMINDVANPGSGQTVEYAISTTNTAPSSGWQDAITFSDLTVGTTYYIFARSKANGDYNTGPESAGFAVRLPDGTQTDPFPLIYDTFTDGTITSANKERWYKFTATANTQNIHVKLGTLSGLDIRLYNSNGDTLGSSYSRTSSGYISLSVVSGQTYYIKVTPYYSSYTGTYQIGFSTLGQPPGTLTTATTLTGSWTSDTITASSNENWFWFTATAATQYIHVKLGTLSGLDIRLYDYDGYALGSSYSSVL
jgi:hypothetical protein